LKAAAFGVFTELELLHGRSDGAAFFGRELVRIVKGDFGGVPGIQTEIRRPTLRNGGA
jgi:hypothetical protein